mmetsp:Transcript_13434/g.56278  ORF Transcript_13434/g.56278 Transcript_13434/m.56278 type:complete len:231 (+) Transcript_13434:3468-4160(+)
MRRAHSVAEPRGAVRRGPHRSRVVGMPRRVEGVQIPATHAAQPHEVRESVLLGQRRRVVVPPLRHRRSAQFSPLARARALRFESRRAREGVCACSHACAPLYREDLRVANLVPRGVAAADVAKGDRWQHAQRWRIRRARRRERRTLVPVAVPRQAEDQLFPVGFADRAHPLLQPRAHELVRRVRGRQAPPLHVLRLHVVRHDEDHVGSFDEARVVVEARVNPRGAPRHVH